MTKVCRHCENCIAQDGQVVGCSKDHDVSSNRICVDYYCAPTDVISGAKHRKGFCIVCGEDVYNNGVADVPIYCKEHRAHAKHDSEVINSAPKELLFSLIAGIFLRAREDYVYNTDGQGSDAEVFLKSEWAQILSSDGFNVEHLFEVLDGEKYEY